MILLLGTDVLAKVTGQGIEQGLSWPCSSFQRGFKLGDAFSRIRNHWFRINAKNRMASVFKENHNWLYRAAVPVEIPIGLIHVDSDFCWCDPIIELDENGQEAVLHRQVTWN